MRILIVNDDGFNAPGFDVMRRIAAQLSDDVWAVAPETDQSGLAHSLTLSHPLRLTRVDERNFVLRGTPTDCVIMGVRELLPSPPDLILSGVNLGQNIADDVTYSGTVAGAMEGAMLGIPSIALSQRVTWAEDLVIRWQTCEHHAPRIVDTLLQSSFDPQMFVNVNFPDCEPDEVQGEAIVPQGALEHGLFTECRRDGRNHPYYWLRFAAREPLGMGETDLSAIQADKITITPLKPDLTYREGLDTLKSLFANA